MSGYDRDHNDGGIVPVPTYSISGFLFEDADYDGLYNYLPETRTDTATGDSVEYRETGYNGKSVYLQKWFYVPNTGTGWDSASVIPAGATVSWVRADGTSQTTKPSGDALNNALGAWVMLDEKAPATPKLSFYDMKDNAYSVGTSAVIDGRVETKTNTFQAITGTERKTALAKTNEQGQAVVDENGKLAYEVVSSNPDGYFRFNNLPTAGFIANGDGNRTWYLMGYTLEVNGANEESGMFSHAGARATSGRPPRPTPSIPMSIRR